MGSEAGSRAIGGIVPAPRREPDAPQRPRVNPGWAALSLGQRARAPEGPLGGPDAARGESPLEDGPPQIARELASSAAEYSVPFVGAGLVSDYMLWRGANAFFSRDEVVELMGKERFSPSPGLRDWIRARSMLGKTTSVDFRFGNLASGKLMVDYHSGFQASRVVVPITLYGMGNELPGYTPVLTVGVADGVVSGLFGAVAIDGPMDVTAVEQRLQKEGGLRLLAWRGLQNLVSNGVAPRLVSGRLYFNEEFQCELVDTFKSKVRLAIGNSGELNISGKVELDVPGLERASLDLRRDSSELAINADAALDLQDFGGGGAKLRVLFREGVLDIRGTVDYKSPSGEIEGALTLLVTDADAAWAAVDGELVRWGAAAVGRPPTLAATDGIEAKKRLAVAGWGTASYRYADWLKAKAQVIVAPDGEVFSLGRVHVPRTLTFLEKESGDLPLLEGSERYPSFGLKFVRTWGRIGLEWGIGPGLIHDLEAEGRFSSRRSLESYLRIGGAVSLDAFATIVVEATLTANVGATVKGLGSVSVARAGVGVKGEVPLKAGAEARAAITRKGGPPAKYFIGGSLLLEGNASLDVKGEALAGFLWWEGVKRFDFLHLDLGSLRLRYDLTDYQLGGSEKPKLRHQKLGRLDGLSLGGLRQQIKAAHDDPYRREDAKAKLALARETAAPILPQPEGTMPSLAPPAAFGQDSVPPWAKPPEKAAPPEEPTAPREVDIDQPAAEAAPESDDLDAGTGVPGGTPMPPPPLKVLEPVEAPPEQPDRGELSTEFTLERGQLHRLTLEPADPPVLIMASEPGPLDEKLERKIDEVKRNIDVDPRAELQQTKTALEDVQREARAVEDRAEVVEQGEPGASNAIMVSGVRELGHHLHTLGNQFDLEDLDASSPPTPKDTPIDDSVAPGQPQAAPSELPQPRGDVPRYAPAIPPLPDHARHVIPDTPTFTELMVAINEKDRATCLALMRQQNTLYGKEVGALTDYLRSLRTGPYFGSAQGHIDRAKERQTKVVDFMVQLTRAIRAIEYAAQPNKRAELPCFSEDTEVLTPAGPRLIGSLEVGAPVFCQQRPESAPVLGVVTDVHRKLTLRFIHVTVAGVTVRATGRHPFWVEDVGDFVAAESLDAGMRVRMYDGAVVSVDAVEQVSVVDERTVDLSVSPFPTYFVGPGIWVHNSPERPIFRPPNKTVPDEMLPMGPYTVYIGTYDPERTSDPQAAKDAVDFANCVYVGQTRGRAREKQHRKEAEDELKKPQDPLHQRFYRFKRRIKLETIIEGIIQTESTGKSKYADYLEQQNINIERSSHKAAEVMNLIDVIDNKKDRDMRELKQWILADRRAREYCP